MNNTPEDLRMVMIDSKMVELIALQRAAASVRQGGDEHRTHPGRAALGGG
ncbi:MAG: hypothetical protein MZV64_02240 [Ignavibacteriales bacterium]|nr:hypothetical protein [Ignavibacteriales bacterium]